MEIGFVNVFKPAGYTSAQIVARVKRIYGVYGRDRKISAGHLGTLDPQAAGVLPVAIGKATRLIPLLEDQRKAYTALLVLGRSTATQDALGETVAQGALPPHWERKLEAALPQFIGKVSLSAANVLRGCIMRANACTNLRAKKIGRAQGAQRDHLRTLRCWGSRRRIRRASASRAARARTCARFVKKLGAAIGVPAHMGALVREASGPFVLYESLTLEEIAEVRKAASRRPNTSSRFRRSCWTCAVRRTFAPAVSCRCPAARLLHASSCAITRARWSASAKPTERFLRREKCLSK